MVKSFVSLQIYGFELYLHEWKWNAGYTHDCMYLRQVLPYVYELIIEDLSISESTSAAFL